MAEVAPERWITLLHQALAHCAEHARETKQDRSRRRKQDILDAATRVFSRKGIAKSKMADIAAEARVPVSSIYDYFESKEELAYEIPLNRYGDFFAELEAALRRESTARERLRAFLGLSAAFATRHPDWARLLYLEIWPSILVGETRIRQVIDDYARIVIELVRDGMRRGEWSAGLDPVRTASILMGSLNQIITTWLLYGRPRDLAAAAEPLIAQAMQVLAFEPARASPMAERA